MTCSSEKKLPAAWKACRKLYGSHGYLDYLHTRDPGSAANATANLNITIEEGPQYHMGKLEMIGARNLPPDCGQSGNFCPEGEAYDNASLDEYLTRARDLLPPNFSKANIQAIQNCPESGVEVRMILESAENKSLLAAEKHPLRRTRQNPLARAPLSEKERLFK